MIRRRRADSSRGIKLLQDIASTVATTPLMAIDLEYLPHLYPLCFVMVELHLYPLLFPLAYHPISLLIVKFWKFSVIPHYGQVWPFFGISAKNWSMFQSDHMLTKNHRFIYLITMEPFHCHHCWLLYFGVIMLFFITISLYFLTSLSIYIQREQGFGNLYLYNYIYQENKVLATDIYITIYPKRTNIWQLVYLQVSIISKLGCD